MLDKYAENWYGVYGDRKNKSLRKIVFKCTDEDKIICSEIESDLLKYDVPYSLKVVVFE